MEFRQLEVFLTVAETKSFSKAAERLFLSQSTISSHIKNLETELKKTLIIRSTKSVRLTEEGQTLVFYIKRLLDTKEAALMAINSPTKAYINLGASTIPSACLLPKLTSGFCKEHPQVSFFIRQSDSAGIMEKVLDGSVELGIVGQKADSSKCISLPFCSDELVIATPATEHFRCIISRPNHLELLLKEPILVREQGSGTQHAADNVLNTMGVSLSELNIAAQCNDLTAIRQMIVEGMGISVMSRLAITELADQKKIYAVPFDPPMQRSFYLVFLKDRTQRPLINDFITYVLKNH